MQIITDKATKKKKKRHASAHTRKKELKTAEDNFSFVSMTNNVSRANEKNRKGIFSYRSIILDDI